MCWEVHGVTGGGAFKEGRETRIHQFLADCRGAVVRDYAVAIVVAALLVIVGLTMVADELYQVYLRAFGP